MKWSSTGGAELSIRYTLGLCFGLPVKTVKAQGGDRIPRGQVKQEVMKDEVDVPKGCKYR